MSGKYKGEDQHAPRAGLNRLRRAHAKPEARRAGWEREAQDEEDLERHAPIGKVSHYAENVRARFNRLVGDGRNHDPAAGEKGEICAFHGQEFIVRDADGTEHACALRRTVLKRMKDVDLGGYRFSTVFVDPPRSGLDATTLAFVAGFDHILYISCNPETQRRDVAHLQKSHHIAASAVFDQFPYTPHLESGLLLERR